MNYKSIAVQLGKDDYFSDFHTGFGNLAVRNLERNFSQSEEREVRLKWDNLLKLGKVSHSSPIVAINPSLTRREGSTLSVSAYSTDYMHYRTTLNNSSLRVWALGVSALTRLNHEASTFYLFGERKKATSDVGGLVENIPGGFMEPEHLSAKDPSTAILEQELMEEIGIGSERIAFARPFYLAHLRKDLRRGGRDYQDACAEFIVDLSGISPEEVKESFMKDRKKREHTKIHIIEEENLGEFIWKNLGRLTLRTRKTLHHYLSND